MLRPTKHDHPDKTVIAVAALLLHRLKNQRVESFCELLHYLTGAREGVGILFLPALNLLFTLGLVEYRTKTDAFEYTGR